MRVEAVYNLVLDTALGLASATADDELIVGHEGGGIHRKVWERKGGMLDAHGGCAIAG